MTPSEIPAGFEPHFRKSPLTDPWEPLYSRRLADRIVLGLYTRQPHTNSRGLIHGGLIAALADNAMGLSCVQVMTGEGRRPEGGLVTVSMATDFIGAAKLGRRAGRLLQRRPRAVRGTAGGSRRGASPGVGAGTTVRR